MHVRLSVIVLFVGFLAIAVATDDQEYDYESLKTMRRNQAICPMAYQEYISNCTQKYDHNIKQCGEDEKAAKLKHQKQATDDRDNFLSNADRSCKSIIGCDSDDYDDVNEGMNKQNAYGCLSKEALKSSGAMTGLYYEVEAMKSDYDKQIKIIEEAKSSCTNSTTWLLSNQNTAALEQLSNCFRTGEWELFEVVLPFVQVSAVCEKFDDSKSPAKV